MTTAKFTSHPSAHIKLEGEVGVLFQEDNELILQESARSLTGTVTFELTGTAEVTFNLAAGPHIMLEDELGYIIYEDGCEMLAENMTPTDVAAAFPRGIAAMEWENGEQILWENNQVINW